ncbi:PstS family phosphate ABC transporter substrate-binding protein [Bacterioplanoides sp. SCSIO 12839]|uniref:PstS family phosphate ABC transporter substrate-binding protein n=1 Tax=Bacterioplanoides sp. SCSIO 12839 TaxID=2829569 RepID=UPI0021055412|nr:PstS family phosphate ABC transporter substrate-binding protein [Bacterioplanoides sp. SCSIO 12839]UTW48602.1 PstS family phosphate ABC transporter substrate-binding protein [Bacterioplanoides sp. SCSIO 12839]
MKKVLLTGAAVMAAALSTAAQAERDYISIVGSSTVYPFSTVVAERFGKSTDFRTPKVESTGSGGGLKLFCAGVGGSTPDITNASRAIKSSEIKLCAKNGVTEIVEVKVGYDGIVLANTKAADRMELSRKDIFLALAKNVPNPDGTETLVENPYKTWKDVNPALPNRKIEVLGPPPTSGTRDAFVELAMEGGCKKVPFIKAIKKQDKKKFKAICHGMREDGAYVEAGENDNLIVQKLVANPNALGIFGFSFLEQNSDKVQGSKVDGKLPTFDAISEGDYPVSRSLFFYVKKAHVGVIPGIEEYLAEFTSERAMGEDGYLADKGMIPMMDDERAEVVSNVKNLKPIAAK